MKKSFFAFIAAFAVALTFVCAEATAQTWTSPIPVGSDANQYQAHPAGSWTPAKSNATDIQFTNTLPVTAADQNFHTNTVTLPGGTVVKVADILATPGLWPESGLDPAGLREMLDVVIAEVFFTNAFVVPAGTTPFPRPDGSCCYSASDTMTVPTPYIPSHGFCPAPFRIIAGSGKYVDYVFECDLNQSYRNRINKTDLQFVAADVRNYLKPDEFETLYGVPPQPDIDKVFASSQESIAPYTAGGLKTYPSNVMHSALPDKEFAWRIPAGPLDEPYKHVYAYGIADFKEGAVTAAYDPVNVEKLIRFSMNVNLTPPPSSAVLIDPLKGSQLDALTPHLTPLIFFRKDDVSKRLRLAGYSTIQMNTYDATHSSESIKGLIWKILMGFNFNTVDVVKLDVGGQNYFAAVNQATLTDLDKPFMLPDLSVTPDKLRAYFKKGDSAATAVDLDANVLPHGVISYVTFWKQMGTWDNSNPNKVWDPVAFSLVGQMFDATSGSDFGKQYLLVASSERASDTKYYVYKISPEQTPETTLSFKGPGGTFDKTPGIVGTPFEVVPPDGDYEWAPFNIVSAKFDDNECGDFAMTWRGRETVPAGNVPMSEFSTAYFDNHDGENVVFRKSKTDERMFSDVVTVYFGKKDPAGKCVFSGPIELRGYIPAGPADPAKRQVAAIAVQHKSGGDDLFAGNANPMPTGAANEFSSFVYHYKVDATHPLASGRFPDDLVRVGYEVTNTGALGADTGTYLKRVAIGDISKPDRAGVGALDIDMYGNIAAVNGLPRMLPWMGCPQFGTDLGVQQNFVVSSTPEELVAVAYEAATRGTSHVGHFRDGAGQVVPLRCVEPTPLPEETCGDGIISADEECDGGTCTSGRPCKADCKCSFCGDGIRDVGFEQCDGADVSGCPSPDYTCSPNCSCVPPPAEACAAPAGYEACCTAIGCPPPTTTAPLVNCCRMLIDGSCPIDTDGHYTGTYAPLCNRIYGWGCCPPSAKLDPAKNEFFAENPRGDGNTSGGGTDYGCREDAVYDSKAPYIASMNALTLAQTNVAATNNKATARAARPPTLTPMQAYYLNQFLSSMGLKKEHIDMFTKDVGQISPTSLEGILFKTFLDVLGAGVIAPPEEDVQRAPQSSLNKAIDKIGDLGLVKEANAHTITGPAGHDFNFRFPRGHIMPGRREMTVVLKATPPILRPYCGNGIVEPGETCERPGDECNAATGALCDATCHCPGEAPTCGDGRLDAGEECEVGIECPTAGEVCTIACQCEPPTTITEECPDCCDSTCSTCSEAKTITMKCIIEEPAIAKHYAKLNELFRAQIPGLKDSDLICPAEYGIMRTTITSDKTAAPSLSAGDLSRSSIDPDLSGNVGKAALIQYAGTKPVDFGLEAELPTELNMVSKPMILWPTTADVASRATRRAIVLDSDVSASISAAASTEPMLSEAAPISADLVTSIDLLPDNVRKLNNVITWQTKAANSTTRAAGDVGVSVNIIDVRLQPLLCSWTARCPEIPEEAKFANVNFDDVLKKAASVAGECNNGTCSVKALKDMGLIPYQIYGFGVVQSQVTKAGEPAGPADVTTVAWAGGTVELGQGAGGCGCDVAATPPSIAAIIAMLFASSTAATGYIALRKRARKK